MKAMKNFLLVAFLLSSFGVFASTTLETNHKTQSYTCDEHGAHKTVKDEQTQKQIQENFERLFIKNMSTRGARG